MRRENENDLIDEEKERALKDARERGASDEELDEISRKFERERYEMEERLRRQREMMAAKMRNRLSRRAKRDKLSQDDIDAIMFVFSCFCSFLLCWKVSLNFFRLCARSSDDEQREGERKLQQLEAEAMKEAHDRGASQDELDEIAKRSFAAATFFFVSSSSFPTKHTHAPQV